MIQDFRDRPSVSRKTVFEVSGDCRHDVEFVDDCRFCDIFGGGNEGDEAVAVIRQVSEASDVVPDIESEGGGLAVVIDEFPPYVEEGA